MFLQNFQKNIKINYFSNPNYNLLISNTLKIIEKVRLYAKETSCSNDVKRNESISQTLTAYTNSYYIFFPKRARETTSPDPLKHYTL